jgi:DNA mismatch repair protein MutS
MQVGGFYELYGSDIGDKKRGDIFTHATLLELEVSLKNKKHVHSPSNPRMAGAPIGALNRYLRRALAENYIAVVITQKGTAKDKKKGEKCLPREVTKIASPGTYYDEDSVESTDNRYLVEIFLRGEERNPLMGGSKHFQNIGVGMSAIDVTTGESDTYETYNSPNDSNYALDEIYRYLQTHGPRELILHAYNLRMDREDLISYLDLENACDIRQNIIYHSVDDDKTQKFLSKAHRRATFEKVFKPSTMNSQTTDNVFHYLGLERMEYASTSYMYLLSYVYQHDPSLIKKLQKPEIWENERHLLLASNAITQLDLISTQNTRQKKSSIYNLINHCRTKMGRRLLKKRLLNPIRDNVTLSSRYDMIDHFQQDELYQSVKPKLQAMGDLDRQHRKVALGYLPPRNCNLLKNYYEVINELLLMVPKELQPSDTFVTDLTNYVKEFEKKLNFDKTVEYMYAKDIKNNIFNYGVYKELDELNDQIEMNHRYLDIMRGRMSSIVEKKGSEAVYKEYTEASGYYFRITRLRYEALCEHLKETPISFRVGKRSFTLKDTSFRILRMNKAKSEYNVSSDDINEIANTLDETEKKLRKKIKEVYLTFLEEISNDYIELFRQMSDFVAEVDFYHSCAYTAIRYNYCRPQVEESVDGHSFLEVTDIRHPIIEQININTTYVPHSLRLGMDHPWTTADDSEETSNNDSTDSTDNDGEMPRVNGLLNYGPNAVGKTALMKAVGVNLVMAQAGMYVSAKRFVYSPYHCILTRILGNDNLFKGLSSFAVEMAELRGILSRADQNSLVLGDEICHGTETTSGTAIIASAIQWLCTESNSQFIFATHLHHLAEMPEITNLPQLGIYHLQVKYDPVSHVLTYDRKLREGPGDPMYGIEVAKAMDLPSTFIEQAHQLRRKLVGQSETIVPDRPSRYNAQLFMDDCQVCHGKGEDTHHIQFQCTADDSGYIGHINKDTLKNLVVLCKSCHQKVHQRKITINGYQQTSQGCVLDFDNEKPRQPSLTLRWKN